MGNLVRFFLRYNGFLLFIFLEILCLILIAENSEYHRTAFINSANNITGGLHSKRSNLQGYLNLRKTNDSLAKANAELLQKTKEMVEVQVLIKDSIRDSQVSQLYTILPAKVVRKTIYKSNNYLTINLGKKDGIRPEMAVIGPDGVVGIVKDVGKNYSTVISILHSSFRMRGELKRTGYFGDVLWGGANPKKADLLHVPKHVDLKVGDSVVSTSFSEMFPQNMMIGRIKTYDIKEESNFCEIELELATNFHTLDYVYVIEDLNKQEIDSLQNINQGG